MGQLPPELAAKIAKARASGGGNNIRHGEYLLVIKNVTYEKKHTGRCLIWEFVVEEAKKIVAVEGTKTIDVEPNQVGTQCSSVINFDGKGKDSAEGNAKQVILGLFGLKEDDVKDDVVMGAIGEATSDAQPARGMAIRCTTYPKEVRSRPGNYITGLSWACAGKRGEAGLNSDTEIARRRALIDGAAKQAASA